MGVGVRYLILCSEACCIHTYIQREQGVVVHCDWIIKLFMM